MGDTNRYRSLIYLCGAILTGAITGWAVLNGITLALVVLSALLVVFFLGGISERTYNLVPYYQQVGALVIGLVSIALVALGYEREILLGLAIVGAASAVDLVVKYVRKSRSKAN